MTKIAPASGTRRAARPVTRRFALAAAGLAVSGLLVACGDSEDAGGEATAPGPGGAGFPGTRAPNIGATRV